MMSRKYVLLVLCATLALAGCGKIHLPWPKKAVAATPAPAPEIAATEPTAPAADSPGAESAEPAAPVRPMVDQSANAMVLCYHNIEEGKGSKALTIAVSQFEGEMDELQKSGFTVIPMQDFLAWRRGEKTIPKKSCIITIDDGWVSGYTNAWPILKKHGFPFTLFIYVSYVGSGGKSLSWQQLEEMRDAGVDIECHTYTHSNLHGKGNSAKIQAEIKSMGMEPWLRKEIVDSKKFLEKQLGIKVNALAYPYGVYNSAVRAMVKEAGYEAAFTVYGQRLTMHAPPADLLGRYAVEAGKPQIFKSALEMVGGGVPAGETTPSSMAQLAPSAMVTQPMQNETIQTQTPLIKANLASMGTVEAGSVALRLSGVGMMPVKYDAASKMMTAQVEQKLPPGPYSVIVTAKVGGQPVEARWDFTVAKP